MRSFLTVTNYWQTELSALAISVASFQSADILFVAGSTGNLRGTSDNFFVDSLIFTTTTSLSILFLSKSVILLGQGSTRVWPGWGLFSGLPIAGSDQFGGT